MEYLRPIWEAIVSCFNCQESHVNQGSEPNERTCLISPVSHTQAVQQSTSQAFVQEYPSSLPKREDQNALSRVVQDTATNIIDAATLEAHNLEPQEYTDRVKIYSHKLQQQWSQVKYPSTSSPKGLLADLPHPEEILAESPCSMADLQMIKSLMQRAAVAVNDIRVDHTEALIVPFRIP